MSTIKIMRLRTSLRDGTGFKGWETNQEVKRQLLRQIKDFEEPLMKNILGSTRSKKETRLVDTRPMKKDAFLDLVALFRIGADWLLTDKYIDDILIQSLIDAVEYKPKAFEYTTDGYKAAAASLLAYLNGRDEQTDHIPNIIKVCQQTINDDAKVNLINSMDVLVKDQRIRDCLIETLKEQMVLKDGQTGRYTHPGPGFCAAEILLNYEDEKSISSAVWALIAPAEIGDSTGSENAARLFVVLRDDLWKKQIDNNDRLCKHLIAILDKEKAHDFHRRNAVSALGLLNAIEAVESLLKILDEEYSKTLLATIKTLGSLGQSKVIPHLLDQLSRPRLIRNNAKDAIECLKDKWEIEHFTQALNHEHKEVRLFAVQKLLEIGDPGAIPALSILENDPVRKVKKTAQEAIKKMS